MKSTCWDTRATDSIIKSGQIDTEASIASSSSSRQESTKQMDHKKIVVLLLLVNCLENFFHGQMLTYTDKLLAIRSICNRKALFAKGSSKSEEFNMKTNALFYSTFL